MACRVCVACGRLSDLLKSQQLMHVLALCRCTAIASVGPIGPSTRGGQVMRIESVTEDTPIAGAYLNVCGITSVSVMLMYGLTSMTSVTFLSEHICMYVCMYIYIYIYIYICIYRRGCKVKVVVCKKK